MAPIEFSLALPTRDRPGLATRMLRSVLETAENPSALEAVLYLDEDDPESLGIEIPGLRIAKITGPRISMGAMSRKCCEAANGRFVAFVNDDAVFRTKGWDRAVTRAFARFGDDIALVYADDGYYGQEVPTFPILFRSLCLRKEHLIADYDRYRIDSHIFDLFQRLRQLGHDRIVYLPDVLFEHRHFGLGLGMYRDGTWPPDDRRDTELYQMLAHERARLAQEWSGEIGSAKTALSSASSAADEPSRRSITASIVTAHVAPAEAAAQDRASEDNLTLSIGDRLEILSVLISATVKQCRLKARRRNRVAVAGQHEGLFDRLNKSLAFVSRTWRNSAETLGLCRQAALRLSQQKEPVVVCAGGGLARALTIYLHAASVQVERICDGPPTEGMADFRGKILIGSLVGVLEQIRAFEAVGVARKDIVRLS